MSKDITTLMRSARDQGWDVESKKRSGHIKFTNPEGQHYFAAGTPSDVRAVKNLIAGLKRLGFVYDQQRGTRRGVRSARLAAGHRRRSRTR